MNTIILQWHSLNSQLNSQWKWTFYWWPFRTVRLSCTVTFNTVCGVTSYKMPCQWQYQNLFSLLCAAQNCKIRTHRSFNIISFQHCFRTWMDVQLIVIQNTNNTTQSYCDQHISSVWQFILVLIMYFVFHIHFFFLLCRTEINILSFCWLGTIFHEVNTCNCKCVRYWMGWRKICPTNVYMTHLPYTQFLLFN